MSMPAQKPHASKQDYGTPRDLLDAIEARFGAITCDLAADAHNAVAPAFFDANANALLQPWPRGLLWLNPPFVRIAPWAARCARSASPERRILLLTPASIGSNWFAEHVHGRAKVLALSPRVTFAGCTTPYPKDVILSAFGYAPGFDVWRWRA